MTPYDIALLIHILLFCYWLGGDVGVFYSSQFVVDSKLSRETRLTAAKIMLGCDLVPKICMSLMLTVGGILAHYLGIEHSLWQLIGIILLGPIWLTMVLVLHYKHNASYIPLLTKVDYLFRWAVIAGLIASSIYAYNTGRLADNPWIIIKLLGFAFLIFCGLMIRINLKEFSITYAKMLQDSHDDADNLQMVRSLKKVKPWVVLIWFVLIFEAYVGIAKPLMS
ncbi:MAG: hypothetical protein CL579_12840 [Alteromonadaceae bacterium]|jgi:hypothetical protein|uniref:Integral membrane protein n=2 Tax=Paraglaciecola mesophila TaxID=197222 RepID=K6YI11_9ALTE|nr:hypothetical protein [Paraglaciecola mesophila]MAD16941.1 hypothetical protein [Alteromonadaceae bacterium]GAC23631.1 conserved hypothetical protein [Paraglaciecola mesophila KMM 241]|tara:strand:+ start:1894 stop:2562 length:669 start_codon:yes stop_codon:yes gene_type:complete